MFFYTERGRDIKLALISEPPKGERKRQSARILSSEIREEPVRDLKTGKIILFRRRRGGRRGVRREGRLVTDEIYDYDYALNNAWALFRESKRIAISDKKIIEKFMHLIAAQGVSRGRQAKYLTHVRLITENLAVPLRKAKRKHIESLIIQMRIGSLSEAGKLRGKKYKPHTINDYIEILKRLFKFLKTRSLDKDTPFPKEVSWLKKTLKANEKTTPAFMRPEWVEKMIEVAEGTRNKAIISVVFEGSFRPSELLSMSTSNRPSIFMELVILAARRQGCTGGSKGKRILPTTTHILFCGS